MANEIYNRKLHKFQKDKQYGGGALEILYNDPIGRIVLKFVIHPFFSQITGWYYSSPLSRQKTASFVKEYHINLQDYEAQDYRSFRDFFIRKIKPEKRPIDNCPESLIAPADSKLSVYDINENQMIEIKGVQYTIDELVTDRLTVRDYEGGYCLVFRLSMDDYHRYSFVDSGAVADCFHVKGKLHTVSSISKKHKVYRENTRVINVLDTDNFGTIVCVEVGALLVGKIINHPVSSFHKGMEKGYFELGGSTIVLLIKPNCIVLDEDIRGLCEEKIEVKVQLGETIATKVTAERSERCLGD